MPKVRNADLAEDIAAALDASPTAGGFFDSLAEFYRRGYLRWIEATKRRPDLRPQRIAGMIKLLEAGQKQRPGQWCTCRAACTRSTGLRLLAATRTSGRLPPP